MEKKKKVKSRKPDVIIAELKSAESGVPRITFSELKLELMYGVSFTIVIENALQSSGLPSEYFPAIRTRVKIASVDEYNKLVTKDSTPAQIEQAREKALAASIDLLQGIIIDLQVAVNAENLRYARLFTAFSLLGGISMGLGAFPETVKSDTAFVLSMAGMGIAAWFLLIKCDIKRYALKWPRITVSLVIGTALVLVIAYLKRFI